MRHSIKILAAISSIFFMTNANAINVSVHSNMEKIDGLGFTANGKQHGGMGNNYEGNDMPKGSYSFGLRYNGKDVGCYDKNGKKFIRLSHSSSAFLHFNGRHCTVNIKSK